MAGIERRGLIDYCMFAKFLFRILYTEGFNRFVTSTMASITTGWSDLGRAGFAPAGKQCLGTAHDKLGLMTLHPVLDLQPRKVAEIRLVIGHQHNIE